MSAELNGLGMAVPSERSDGILTINTTIADTTTPRGYNVVTLYRSEAAFRDIDNLVERFMELNPIMKSQGLRIGWRALEKVRFI